METNNDYFTRFQNLCLSILAQSDNCQESQDMFRATKTIPELVSAWQRYWAGLLHEVPEQVIKAFSQFYPTYRDDIIRAGVYYNEAPPIDHITPSIILIGDAPEATVPEGPPSCVSPLEVFGRHRVYVLGNLPIITHDNCNVLVNSSRSNVTLHDNCRCNLEAGNVILHDRSMLNGSGNVTCYDSTTILLMGGTLHDKGHLDITAYNDAVIHTFTSRKITLNDKAKIYFDK